MKKEVIHSILHYFIPLSITLSIVGCDNTKIDDESANVENVPVASLSDEMRLVRDYVPKFTVMAHRGTTFWAPEETEASFRWARDMGADYLECDLQVSKDGVILALHDDNLKRTTNIEVVFGENLPQGRLQYYLDLGYSSSEAQQKVIADKKAFRPYLPSYYTYEEMMQLDAGSWFNEDKVEQARPLFADATKPLYISTLEDLVQISRGYILARDGAGKRIYTKVKTAETINGLSGEADKVLYTFSYISDPNYSGNVPGIYTEFKEPWLNPKGFEQMVYDELDRLGMNIITKPEPNKPQYIGGKVNVGNTNGKVILQTFSLESLVSVSNLFQGKIPMCFLLWKGEGATDISNDSPHGYASFINLGVQYKAHIMGPSIAGAPNDYAELNKPWQDYLIEKSGMLNHPYSFDSRDQMAKYYGDYNFENDGERLFNPPYLDAMFTNRTEMTLQYFIDKGVRDPASPQTVPNPQDLLTALGY